MSEPMFWLIQLPEPNEDESWNYVGDIPDKAELGGVTLDGEFRLRRLEFLEECCTQCGNECTDHAIGVWREVD